MSRRTNPEKQARKTAFRIARTETIERVRRERQEAFNEMFADVIEKTPAEDIDALAKLSTPKEIQRQLRKNTTYDRNSIDGRLFVEDQK